MKEKLAMFIRQLERKRNNFKFEADRLKQFEASERAEQFALYTGSIIAALKKIVNE